MKIFGKWLPLFGFKGSSDYWNRRYELGGDSGAGSGGKAAEYKATVINRFVADNNISDVIEFGCGDGRQLTLAKYKRYLGLDISENALQRCRELFAKDPTKRFASLQEYGGERADLAMSLDVIFHLVEDDVYNAYLDRLFAVGERYVVIYSTNESAKSHTLKHVRHRAVDKDVADRFPQFARMVNYENALPQPIESGAGGLTRFILYSRLNA